MLVLSRAVGEVISIGDDIAVHILELNGNQVKFGVAAPAGCMFIAPRSTRKSSNAKPPSCTRPPTLSAFSVEQMLGHVVLEH